MSKHLIFVSAPGLRRADVDDPARTPNLCALAGRGWCRPIRATFPCVTSSVQASMWTGLPANRHGVVANGFYFRDRNEVEFWVGRNGRVQSEQIWNRLRAAGKTSAVWHAQNIKDAAADFIVTPEPIHEPDGSMKLWCYAKPAGLYEQLLAKLGHFPLQHYWGPMAGIQSSEWIVKAASWLHRQHAPNFQFVYLPHLDYAGQKDGPDSEPARKALADFDRVLGELVAAIDGPDVSWLVVSEYVMTAVDTVVFPNRMLREAGHLSLKHDADGRELPDLKASRAFAMVDHQFAHVYVRDPADVPRVAELFRESSAIESVLVGRERASHAIDHERSGEIVLITRPNAWLAYYWWLDDAAAPNFARTVDIHAKPGYDPVELFFDPATKSIPLNASLVKGSHGAPAELPQQEGVILCSGGPVRPADRYRDIDMPSLISSMRGVR
jgi:predicted AlkP superfamily pyrophosphatase or phosphodiesterase